MSELIIQVVLVSEIIFVFVHNVTLYAQIGISALTFAILVHQPQSVVMSQ